MSDKTTESVAKVEPVTKVLVLYTGGTIGMKPSVEDNPASPLRPASQDELAKLIPSPLPGLSTSQCIGWKIEELVDDQGKQVGPLDSSSVGPKHWSYMAAAIENAYSSYDGFVILHGTDTMAFTASALSFLLHNLSKPVVITGSQLPIFNPRTDGRLNFINALNVAGYRATGLPRVPEVTICFGQSLLRGNRTTKVSTSGYEGFDTPNYIPLGTIGEYIKIDQSLLRPVPEEDFYADKKVKESVSRVALYPGMDPAVIAGMLDVKADGIILQCFGTGNAPDDESFLAPIRKAVANQKIVVNTTQCLQGSVEMGLYEASSGLQAAGVVTGLDLTPEAALTKLMWLLAIEDSATVPVEMQVNQRGEQTGSVFEIKYGAVGSSTGPVEVAVLGGLPHGTFKKEFLKRAILRVAGFGMENTELKTDVDLSVFVNLRDADAKTPETAPQFAGRLSTQYQGAEKTTLLREITAVVARVHGNGRPINLNLVAPNGKKFWATGVYLTLFFGEE